MNKYLRLPVSERGIHPVWPSQLPDLVRRDTITVPKSTKRFTVSEPVTTPSMVKTSVTTELLHRMLLTNLSTPSVVSSTMVWSRMISSWSRRVKKSNEFYQFRHSYVTEVENNYIAFFFSKYQGFFHIIQVFRTNNIAPILCPRACERPLCFIFKKSYESVKKYLNIC